MLNSHPDWTQEFKEKMFRLHLSLETGPKPAVLVVSQEFYNEVCKSSGIQKYWQATDDCEVLIDPDANAEWRLIPIFDGRKLSVEVKMNKHQEDRIRQIIREEVARLAQL